MTAGAEPAQAQTSLQLDVEPTPTATGRWHFAKDAPAFVVPIEPSLRREMVTTTVPKAFRRQRLSGGDRQATGVPTMSYQTPVRVKGRERAVDRLKRLQDNEPIDRDFRVLFVVPNLKKSN